jgi:hypothetical protein
VLVAASQISGPVIRDQLFPLLQREIRKDLGEAFMQVKTDEALQVREIDRTAGRNTGT